MRCKCYLYTWSPIAGAQKPSFKESQVRALFVRWFDCRCTGFRRVPVQGPVLADHIGATLDWAAGWAGQVSSLTASIQIAPSP